MNTLNAVPVDRLSAVVAALDCDWQVFGAFSAAESQVIKDVAIYNAINKTMAEKPALPAGKTLVRATTKPLKKEVELYDGKHDVTDGSFGHIIVVSVAQAQWDTSFFPASLKKSVESTSALTALTGKPSAAWIDKTKQTAICFTEADKETACTGIACLLPEIAPWLVDKPAPDSDEMALLTAIRKNKIADFKKLMLAKLDEFDEWLAPRKMEKEFTALAESAKTTLVDKYKRTLETAYAKIRELRESINRELGAINETSQIYEALRTGDGGSLNIIELKDAFKNYKSLKYDHADGTNIYFTIRQPLVAWNVAEFERRYKNTSSTVYLKGKNLADLLYGCIVKQRFDIWAEADMIINVAGGLSPNYDTTDPVVLKRTATAIPHPHMVHHHCIGSGNGEDIDEFMRQGRYVSAIEQAISAASGVNIHEGATFEPFIYLMSDIWDTQKCMSADGENFYTPAEAYDIMKEEGVI